jgi:hypothetical protein
MSMEKRRGGEDNKGLGEDLRSYRRTRDTASCQLDWAVGVRVFGGYLIGCFVLLLFSGRFSRDGPQRVGGATQQTI